MLKTLLGINYKTTLAAIIAIIAVIGKIAAKWKAKDFSAIFADGQELFADIGILVAAIGLLSAKDNDTKGAGASAVKVDSQ